MNEKEMHENVTEAGAGAHPEEALLLQYLEGDASQETAKHIEKHLTECAICFQTAATFHRQELEPAYQGELLDEQEKIEIDVDGQMEKMFSEASKKTAAAGMAALLTLLWANRKRSLLSGGFIGALLIFLFFALKPSALDKSDALIFSSLESLKAAHQVNSQDELRLSGGFEFSEFTQTLSGEEDGAEEETVKTDLFKAHQLDPENEKALHYLGTHALLKEKNIARADSFYAAALLKSPNDREILNDVAVGLWQKGDLEQAKELLTDLVSQFPDFREAQYNLAVATQQQGLVEQAKAEWRKYLEIDGDEKSLWRENAKINLRILSNQ